MGPEGEIVPFESGVPVRVYFASAKVAVTQALSFIVTLQVDDVPVPAPDQRVKVEPMSGVAVKFTTVPALKFVPAGVAVTPPVPVPALFTVRAYCGTPAWLTEKIFPAMVKAPDLAELLGLLETE